MADLDQLVREVSRVDKDHLVRLDSVDQQEKLGHQDLLDKMALQVQMDDLVRVVHVDLEDLVDLVEKQVRLVREEDQDQEDQVDHLDQQDNLEKLVNVAHLEKLV
jgi:hypothetical protein